MKLIKLIKLYDKAIGTTYINADRLISVSHWAENDSFQEGSVVEYWDGKNIVELVVRERPEEIMEMVNG